MAPEPFVDARTAAELFQVSPHTAHKIASEHKIPAYRLDLSNRWKTWTCSELSEDTTAPIEAKLNIGRDAERSGTGTPKGGQ